VTGQQGAQDIRNTVFVVLWLQGGSKVAVEIAVTAALATRESQWVCHRYQRQAAAPNAQDAGTQFFNQAPHGDGSAGLIPMHRTQNDQTWPWF
jgi:hypothetical protein